MKHNIHSRQPPEQHKTKDIEIARMSIDKNDKKPRKFTETGTKYFKEIWEYRIGMVGDKRHWGRIKPGLRALNLTLTPSAPEKTFK